MNFLDLTNRDGGILYGEALELQKKLVQARLDGRIEDILLLLEHRHVITKGTRTDPANIYFSSEQLKMKGIEVFEVNRGGDVTYHGPGQLIGYPIVQLKDYEQGIRWFIRALEDAIIDLLSSRFGISGHVESGKYTGVWVGEKKIAAFGLAVVHGVTMHGFALNINTELSYFDLINPCGLSRGVTSVLNETGEAADLHECAKLLIPLIEKKLDTEIVSIDREYLMRRIAL